MQKTVEIQWVESKENIADIMVKPLPEPSHLYLRENFSLSVCFRLPE